MNTMRRSVEQHGYAITDLEIPFYDRVELATLGCQVVNMALEDQRLFDALQYNPHPNAPGKDIFGCFIGAPRVAKDDSTSFHTGWRSANVAATTLGGKLPYELKRFFTLQQETLHAVNKTWAQFIDNVFEPEAAGPLKNMLFHEDNENNNHHIRIVRYPSTLTNGVQETFSAHGDLSVVTSSVFESDPDHVHIAPYPLSAIADIVNEPRYESTMAIKARSAKWEYDMDDQAGTFLGFASPNVSAIIEHEDFDALKAGYHYGEDPGREPLYDLGFGDDRIAIVAFGHPHFLVPYTQYRSSTKYACRPEQVFSGNTKAPSSSR